MGVEGHDPDPNMPCQLCTVLRKDHGEKHHPFVEKGQDPGAALGKPKKEASKPGTTTLIVAPAPDLVLRQVLLRKGLVTSEELEAMERELTVGTLGIQPPGQASHVFAEPPANT